MQMKQAESESLHKIEAESAQKESEAADLASGTEAAKRAFLDQCVPHDPSSISFHSRISKSTHTTVCRMRGALAEKRAFLNLPAKTDQGEASLDPDATKMKALLKELPPKFQALPVNGRLVLYGSFLAAVEKFRM